MTIIIKNCFFPDFKKKQMCFGNVEVRESKIHRIENVFEYGRLLSSTIIDEACSKISKQPFNNELCNLEQARVIDAKGKVLSPGFIDIHMHEEDFLNEGEEYVISKMMVLQGVTTCIAGQCGVQKQPVSKFREVIEKKGGAPVNYMIMTGYNAKRTAMGIGRHEEPTASQLEILKEQVRQEVKEGAAGISFGIEYDPGMTTEEIIEIVKSVEDDYIMVAAHYRADGEKAIEAIEEMIEIQRRTGKNFQISHLSSCSAMGNMGEALHIINNEIRRNPKLNYDTYPYNAFSTTIGSEVFEEGCLEGWHKTYSDILLTDEPYKNVRCSEKIFKECRANYPEMLAVAFVMNEDEIAMAAVNEYGMIASDGIINHGNGHPRAAGTFPRFIGKYVREENRISLLSALEKVTKMPASRMELKGKGEIKIGYDADLVLFDYEKIRDGATFENINIPPVGIEFVMVAGEIGVKNNNILQSNLGRFIAH